MYIEILIHESAYSGDFNILSMFNCDIGHAFTVLRTLARNIPNFIQTTIIIERE